MDFYIAAVIQALCFGPLVVGLFLSMKIFNIPDITTDGSYTLGAVITAVGLSQGYPPMVALLLAMGGGALAGCCTALIHTWVRIHALLAGILVMTALYSVNLVLLGRSIMPLLDYPDVFYRLGMFDSVDGNTLSVLLLFVLLLLLAMSYLLHSDFGIALRATGEDRKSTRLNSSHVKISYAVFC